jgi:hypothetical protein
MHNSARMPHATFRNRRARSIENADVRVTVLEGGGHIAEVLDKQSGVNPLWIPTWPSIEPSAYRAEGDRVYGASVESQLLAGLMGHNLCLDIFGGPSPEEQAAGLQPHGEASVARYELSGNGMTTRAVTVLNESRLRVERQLELHGRNVRVLESVENLSATARPVGWTQHVTLGPPFLEHGATEFRASATRSKVVESVFGSADYLVPASEFTWPDAPRSDGAPVDLRVYTSRLRSSAFTTHLMDPETSTSFFVAFSPGLRLAFGYVWRRADFPWMGIWEENRSRLHAPWNGEAVTRGMEFGVSPFAESRRQMIDRGSLFNVPTYRWIPAKTRVEVEYWIVTRAADVVPDGLDWP